MKKRERNGLIAAGVIAVALIASRGMPAVVQSYQARQDNIEAIQTDIARQQRLIEDTVIWRERVSEIENRLQNLQQDVFAGGTVPQVSANIQRSVRQYANETGVSIISTKLAESLQTQGWLLVQQEMSFNMSNQSNTLEFLRRLESSQPHLEVIRFDLRRSRNQFTGTVTVVGFSRNDARRIGQVEADQAN